jgi:hypothetical protein
MKHRLLSLAVTLSVLAGFLSVVVAEAPLAHASPTAVYPKKIAVVVMENQSATAITQCSSNEPNHTKWNTPFLCSLINDAKGNGSASNLVYGGTVGTGSTTNHFFAGSEFMADPPADGYTNSAPNYSAEVSGDDCAGLANDTYFNTAMAPLTEGGANNCGKNLLKMIDEANANGSAVDWRMYAEDFSSNGSAVTCFQGYSDGSVHAEYVRKHNTAAFFEDINPAAGGGDCSAGGNTGKVLNWPYPSGKSLNDSPFNDTNNDERPVCGNWTSGSDCDTSSGLRDNSGAWPFKNVTLPALSFVVPNLCHDWHTNTTSCTTGGDQFGEFDGSTESGSNAGLFIKSCVGTGGGWDATKHCGGTGDGKAKLFAGDYMLSKIIPNLRDDVGPLGVVIILTDEGGSSAVVGRTTDAANQIPTFVLPGTEAGVAPYDIVGADSATGPAYNTDQAGLLAGLINALTNRYSGTSTYISCGIINGQGDGETACTDAASSAPFADNSLFSNAPIELRLKVPAPTITSFTPSSGFAGDHVTITGSGFAAATAVSFNGTAATSFTITNDSSIDAVVPSSAGNNSGTISVTNEDSSVTSAGSFTYNVPTITSFNNNNGNPGQAVTLTGTNFTGATSVKLGGVTASFSVTNSTTISTSVPAGAATGTWVVQTPTGTSAPSSTYTVVSWTVIGQATGTSASNPNVNITAATAAGDVVVAVIGTTTGAQSTTVRPSGFAATKELNGALIDVCAACAAITSGTNLSFTLNAAANWTLTIIKASGLANSAVDVTAQYTSNANLVTVMDSGLTPTTTLGSEIIIGNMTENGTATPTLCTPSCSGTFAAAGVFQTSASNAGNLVAVSATITQGTYESFATISTAVKCRGVVVALK